MTDYNAPTRDMNFVLNELAGLKDICNQQAFADSSPDVIATVIDEAAKFANGVLAPLNKVGDLIGTKIVGDQVREASGFSEAYQRFTEAGWTTLPCTQTYGGMGLPETVGIATMEMWSAANVSFALCPMLSQGAIEAVQSHANDDLRSQYLEKMISGEWTGTMNLTEPQAGSDLAAINTKAKKDGDVYRIQGTKIFITWGDHNMTDNIIHLVLARAENAPEGVKGISLFLVPKFLVSAEGVIQDRNDVYPTAVEHKIGIHGSPTCIMTYGSKSDGAIGYLIGEENMGLSYMFTMMNHARINVGVQGVALADRAYQQSVRYASERIQGAATPTSKGAIIDHPDVQRMLMLMRALTEGSRALCYVTAAAFDMAHHADDEYVRSASSMRGELLTPIAKAWSTEVSQEVTSLGVQIHGGMGYIEETGAAQYMRDARITTIYEGTSGIQANDFTGRKVIRDQGRELQSLIQEMRLDNEALAEIPQLSGIATALDQAIQELEETLNWLLKQHVDDNSVAGAAAFNFLMGAGTCIAGWLLGKSAVIAFNKEITQQRSEDFYRKKVVTSRFYASHILPRAHAYLAAATSSNDGELVLTGTDFFDH
ncbi:MAG: alkylation response protein AidB-like acyl-CoA dehydrogenase [Patiriisocius sp.]|jgi:acyl-CoA dehydrogenase